MLGRNSFPPIGELPYFLTLPAHGFFWLLLSDTASPPAWHVERLPAAELPVLVLSEGLTTFLADRARFPDGSSLARRTLQHLEQEVLPEFLRPRGWLARHLGRIQATRLGARSLWRHEQKPFLLSFVEVEQECGGSQRYFLPLTIVWEDTVEDGALRTAEWTLAKVREHARVGVLVDAFADPSFCVGLAQLVVAGAVVPFAAGELRFEPTGTLVPPAIEPDDVHHIGAETTNTSVILDDLLFLKAYRRAEPGPHPDLEMTAFLTRAGFASIAALAGSVTYVAEERTAIAALFAYVRNQGDAWTYALNHLERYATGMLSSTDVAGESPHTLFTTQMHTLGRRIGEMHGVLAGAGSDEAAFAPEPVGSADLQRWCDTIRADAEALLGRLVASLEDRAERSDRAAQADATESQTAREVDRELVLRLLARRERLLARIRALCSGAVTMPRIRHHGNLHLGKILLIADDLLITGFEGDAALPIAERRCKESPLRDVATVLRSFDGARASALGHAIAGRPELRERLEPAFEEWLDLTTSAFLAGYRAGVRGSRCDISVEAEWTRLLTLFQIGLALREALHELEHRPSWISVPVGALLRLLG
jgi:maltose alpha-D-glucosyltransferase/alpha-amylase